MTSAVLPGVTGTGLRRFMRRWPSGVAIVTSAAVTSAAVTSAAASSAGQPGSREFLVPFGCTVNAFISVSLRPPLVLLSLSEQSHTRAVIAEHQVFCVNVLASRQTWLADRFAGPATDRFADVRYRWRDAVPVFDGNAATAVCDVTQIVPCADHALVLGSPRWCDQDDAAEPAVFSDGRFQHLLGRPSAVQAGREIPRPL